jgi:hypothetical protein
MPRAADNLNGLVCPHSMGTSFDIRTQHGVYPRLVSATLFSEPSQNIRINPDGHQFLAPGHSYNHFLEDRWINLGDV